MGRIAGVIITILILSACGENVKREPIKKQPQVPEVDSLAIHWSSLVDSYFTHLYDNKKFNGTVLFAHCGEVFFQKAYGVKDFKSKEPLDINDNFQLASVSKPITSIAVLQLVEQNKLALDSTVNTYIPEFPYEEITIRMLLTHKSGLFNYMYFCDRYWDSWTTPISNEETLELIIKEQPDIWFYPGRKYNYSNTGYMLLALLVERISGQSFAYYVNDHIFKPSGMLKTQIFDACLEPEVKSDGVVGYRPNKRRAEASYLDGVVGDKGVYSNVMDMFRLDQALYNQSLLKDETLKEAYTPQHERLLIDDNYGLGWRIDSSNPEAKVVYHAGWWKGFRTHFIRILPNQATIIVLANHQRVRIPRKKLMELMGY